MALQRRRTMVPGTIYSWPLQAPCGCREYNERRSRGSATAAKRAANDKTWSCNGAGPWHPAATASPLSDQIGTADAFVECFPPNPVQYNGNGISLIYADVPTAAELLLLQYLP